LAAVYTPRKERLGTAMVLASATGFGTLAILAKLGYSAGLGTQQMLAFRFVLAAIGMVALAAIAGQNPLLLGRSRLLTLLSMGALFYSAQSLTYFLALRTLPASLVVLIAYIYPSLVVAAGRLFLRRKVTAMHGMALAASFLGLVLLVGGAHFQLSWALLLALASPVVYTGYILVGERVMGSAPALGASAVIMIGAAIGFGTIALVTNELTPPQSLGGWAIVVALALLPTMLAITLFLGGLPRVGASRAALLSTWEPVVTVMLAAVILGDRLSVVQVIGGLLVLLAVVVVQGAQLWRPDNAVG
jgi:drug/metabolite transporter (DMT)-like permease